MKAILRNACGLLLGMCSVLASDRLPAQASSAEGFDTKIERAADMLMQIQVMPVEFGARAAANDAVLSALAPNQDATKVACLRTELSREGFRKRKLAQVRAYAESDRQQFNADYAALEGGLATLLQEFEEGRQSEASAEQADQRLVAFFSDPQYRGLRRLTGHTYMENTSRLKNYSTSLRSDAGARSMALAVDPAFQTCHVPLTKWLAEIVSFTGALEDPSGLEPEFGRTCKAQPADDPEGDSSKRTVSRPRMDPAKPIGPFVYPQVQRRAGIEGVVEVKLFVNEQGQTMRASVGRSSGYVMLDSVALQSARDWQFIPADRAGNAVCADHTVPVTFALKP